MEQLNCKADQTKLCDRVQLLLKVANFTVMSKERLDAVRNEKYLKLLPDYQNILEEHLTSYLNWQKEYQRLIELNQEPCCNCYLLKNLNSQDRILMPLYKRTEEDIKEDSNWKE